MGDVAFAIPIDVESGGLVDPLDLVEIQEFGELTLAVVREVDLLVGKRGRRSLGSLLDRYPSPTVA